MMDKRVVKICSAGALIVMLGSASYSASGGYNEEAVKNVRITIDEESTPLTSSIEDIAAKEPVNVELTAGVAAVFDADELSDENMTLMSCMAPATLDGEVTEEQTDDSDTEDEYGNLAIAKVDHYVNVRTEPNTNSSIVGKMYDGSVAQILSTTGEGEDEWFQVVSGNVEGYIKAEYFIYGDAAADVIEDYISRYAVIKADRLNVRKGPDVESSRIGYIVNGEKVKLVEVVSDEWIKVEYTSNKEGYVASQYVTIEEEFIYAKSIEEELAELAAQRALAERANTAENAAPENTTIQVTPPPTDFANVSELRNAIVNYAMQYLGNRYVHGGQTLAGGTDCSGFTCYVFKEFGIGLSRIPHGQWTGNGRRIDVSEIQPGDIVCYSSNGSKCSHVAIYIGNGKVIHSFNSRQGVVISDMYYDRTFIGVKNVLD